jgi:hypothetical protein
MNAHTKGPWRVLRDGSIFAGDVAIGACTYKGNGMALGERNANARRIADCVNACDEAGWEPGQGSLVRMDSYDELRAENERLRAALAQVQRDGGNGPMESNNERACERVAAIIHDRDENMAGVVRLVADAMHFCGRNLIRWTLIEGEAVKLIAADDDQDDRAGHNGPRWTYAPHLRGPA